MLEISTATFLRLGLILSSAASIFDLYHWLTSSPKRRSSWRFFFLRWAILCILQSPGMEFIPESRGIPAFLSQPKTWTQGFGLCYCMKVSGQMNTRHMGTSMKLAFWKIHLRCVVPRLLDLENCRSQFWLHLVCSRKFFVLHLCVVLIFARESALFQAFLLQSESEKALTDAAPVGPPPNIPRASLAFVGEGNFVLDAEPQDLAWSPKTISVVTWPQWYRSTFLLF